MNRKIRFQKQKIIQKNMTQIREVVSSDHISLMRWCEVFSQCSGADRTYTQEEAETGVTFPNALSDGIGMSVQSNEEKDNFVMTANSKSGNDLNQASLKIICWGTKTMALTF